MQVNTEESVGDPGAVVPASEDTQVSQVQNQTTFEDTTPLTKVTHPNQLEKLYKELNPFPENAPMDILTRAVKIETVHWTSASTFWQFEPLQTIVGTSVLHSQILGNLNAVYGMYRFLRCGFKITVKLNSTPYHQGTLIVSWIPPMVTDTNMVFLEAAAGNHAIVLSASQQDQCEFHIPYLNPDPFWDMYKYSAGLHYGPQMIITVMNNLLTSNGAVADDVPITIWMQIENPHVAGLLPTTYNSSLTSLTSSTITTGVQNDERVFKAQSGKDLVPRPAKEAERKKAKGVTATGPLDLVMPLVKSVPLLGTALELGKAIISALDKPLSDVPPTLVSNRAQWNLTCLQGVFQGDCLGSMPITRVSKDIGLISSDMTVSQYAQLPNWFRSTSVSTAGVVFVQAVHPCLYNNSSTGGRGKNPDYLGFMAAMFSYWRGSIKFLIQFVGTAFYSCTFRVTVYYGLGLSKGSERAAIADGVGCYSRVVTVRGDAWTEIQVPFLHKRAWDFTNTNQQVSDQSTTYPWLMLEALTDVQGSNSPAAASYYINVFRAGGEDIEFAQLGDALWTDPQASTVDERVWQSQCSLVDKFSKPFDQLVPGVTGAIDDNIHMGDKAGTITDLCKRFVKQFNGNQAGNVGRTYQTYPYNVDATLGLQPLFWLGWGFAYWKGSMRITTVDHTNFLIYLPTPTTTPVNSYRNGDGVHVCSSQAPASAEIPYYSRAAFAPSIACNSITTLLANYELPALGGIANISSANFDTWIAFGDDAAYFHPISPYPVAGGKQNETKIVHGRMIQENKVLKPPETIIGMKMGVSDKVGKKT